MWGSWGHAKWDAVQSQVPQPWSALAWGKQEAIFSNGFGLMVSSEETVVASSTCRRSPCFPGNKVKIKLVKHKLLCKVKPPAVKPGIRPWFWSVRQQGFCIQYRATTTLPCLSMAAAENERHVISSRCMCCFRVLVALVPKEE